MLNANEQGNQSFDPLRSVRMGSYGALFYGPFSYWWYKFLDVQCARVIGKAALPLFLAKVFIENDFVLSNFEGPECCTSILGIVI